MFESRCDPSLLPAFLAVLETGSISAAAKTMHLSQPAVTAQVRRLEASLGAALFLRSVRGVAPTEAGLRLATHARAIGRLLDRAASDISVPADNGEPLVLAASTTIAAHLLPPLLAEFRAIHRSVPLRIRVANTEHVVTAVRAGHTPLGLVEGYTRAAGIRLESFVDDEIVPVVGRTAAFTIRRARDFETVPILWREPGSGTRAVVARALRRANLRRRGPVDHDIEFGGTEAVIGAAAAGLGVGFVSRWSIRAHLAAGWLHVVPGLDLIVRRTFCWALPTGALSGAARQFYEFAQRRPPS